MKELKFPLLNPNQIEVRVGQVTKKGYTLLLYKTSRTDAEILDQIVGVGNWQKKFYTLQGVGIGDNMRSIVVCSVGIYDEDKNEWVWKDDSGTESQVEQDKGICSDAFKRASGGSCWGIGRELYYTGFLFVPATTKKKDNGKGYELNDDDKYRRLEVLDIKWKENPLKLERLVIADAETSEVVLSRGVGASKPTTSQKEPKTTSLDNKSSVTMKEINASVKSMDDYEQEYQDPFNDNDDIKFIKDYYNNLQQDRKEKFEIWLFTTYQETKIDKLNESQAKEVANALKKQLAKELERKASEK